MGRVADAFRVLMGQRFETYPPESISQNPSQSLITALGANPSSAGVNVNEQTVQGIPAVFACDKVIKEDLAKVPIKLMRRRPDGTREPDETHPVYTVLHDLPNPVMTPSEFKETMQCAINLWGNAYAEIERDSRNRVKALWPLEASRMTVDMDGMNRLRYRYELSDGQKKTWIFDPANPPILHIRQNALDGIHGRSPVRVLREAMGLALASQEAAARFYGQGMLPAGALQSPHRLDEPAAKRLRNDMEAILGGVKGFHRIAILDRDLKWQPITMPAKDAEFVDTRKLSRSELAGVYRVPSHKINDMERATFSNIEHQAIEWATDGLMPHFVRWQQAIARDLLNPISSNTHYATFVVDALIQTDIKSRNEALQVQRQNGIINANEWRRKVDMDDQISEEDGGNLYLVNGSLMPMRRDPAATLGDGNGLGEGMN